MGTRSNLKFESPPNPRGILALIICECIVTVIRFYLLLVIRFEILKENSDEM